MAQGTQRPIARRSKHPRPETIAISHLMAAEGAIRAHQYDEAITWIERAGLAVVIMKENADDKDRR